LITDAVLSFFSGLVTVVLSWLPNPAPPDFSSFTGALHTAFQYFGWANSYIPLDVILGLVGVLLTVWSAMTVFRASVWVLTKAHVLGGE
jgi:hypothetical protein